MSIINNIENYHTKQNLSKWKIIQKNENEKFSNIIVIPAISEYENILKLSDSLLLNDLKNSNKTLALFVVNNKFDDSLEIKSNNLHSIEFLKKIIYEFNEKLKFGYIDCSTAGNELPEKDAGAGLARKIGMDLALKCFDNSNNAKKILISLDADCLISENYIEEIERTFAQNNCKAAVINFQHQLSENIEQNLAIVNYEIFLRYYILGLKYAKSLFAFHTIGSTFAVDPEIYLKVGGMNKKKAGEDFYFLQKVAKLTEINKVANATVYPSSRISWRVPFGTGPRIKRFLENKHDEYLVYSPNSFKILKNWLIILSEIDEMDFSNDKYLKNIISFILEKSKFIHQELHNFLISQNFDSDWKNILQNSKSKKQLNQNIKNWMDGFRTLKLIHHLRDFVFPNENMFESVNKFLQILDVKIIEISSNINSDFQTQIKFLNKLRKLT
ncbi:MAG: hypothetical protein IPM32_05545 [Ignavibacteriae bacterium]|nr:hypothetical protein [Ignavibacteriota bacterium]